MVTLAGYSGTPLARKLGYPLGTHAHLIGAPSELLTWLAPLPEAVLFDAQVTPLTDLVHLFCTERQALPPLLPRPLQLHTFQAKRHARAFYERQGFVAVAFSAGAANEERRPDVLYRLDAAGGQAGAALAPAAAPGAHA